MKRRAVVTPLSRIKPTAVRWLWPRRIPRGKLTLIIGDPDVGKSFLTLDISARVSTGRKWPDGTRATLGDVILLSAEDAPDDTIVPRLQAMKGDARRVRVLTTILTRGGEDRFSLVKDVAALDHAVVKHKAALVIIDPLNAYLGKTIDPYKDSDVRQLLLPLQKMAGERDVAVVGVMHLTKDAQRNTLHRATGSIAFMAAPRAVFAVVKDRTQERRRFLVPVKFNLGPQPPTMAFRLKRRRVKWSSKAITVAPDVILRDDTTAEDGNALETAMKFLKSLLKEKPMLADYVKKAAKLNAISERTLERAKARLGIVSKRMGGIAEEGNWIWKRPQ